MSTSSDRQNVSEEQMYENKAVARIGVLEAGVDLSRFDILFFLDFV